MRRARTPLPKRINTFIDSDQGLRAVGIAAIIVLITAIASFGANDSKTTSSLTDVTADAFPSATPLASASASASDAPSATTGPSSGPVALPPSAPVVIPRLREDQIPNFGLRTQGITDKTVKVGISGNFSNCGDTAGLASQFAGVIGNPKRAIDAFTRYINDTGGIGGRKYSPILVEDGGSGCPERNTPAAVKMADEDKVFLAIPGLDVESDYIIKRKVPVWGGRDIPQSLKDYGPNGLQLLEPHDPTLEAWASFGKYYLHTDNTDANNACLIRIETGASGNWDIPQDILVKKMAKYGLKFRDIVVFKDDASTAQTQASTIAAREKAKGCQQVWFMAGNPVGLVFFTEAASQAQWYPKVWTFTSRTAGTDTELLARLMDQRQWEHAVGLSIRVKPGQHYKEGNCADIYKHYYPNDGASESAAVIVACPDILMTAEIMRRAIERTGRLDANTFMVGADSIRGDYFYDATVPIEYRLPSVQGPFKTRGFSHYTVADWSSAKKVYEFPKYPCYYRVFKPNGGGCEDLSSSFKKPK